MVVVAVDGLGLARERGSAQAPHLVVSLCDLLELFFDIDRSVQEIVNNVKKRNCSLVGN